MELLQKVSRLDRRPQSPPENLTHQERFAAQKGHFLLGPWLLMCPQETGVAWFLILSMLHPGLEGTLCSRLCFGGFPLLVSPADF